MLLTSLSSMMKQLNTFITIRTFCVSSFQKFLNTNNKINQNCLFLLQSPRFYSSTTTQSSLSIYEHALSESNIVATIERMKHIRLGKVSTPANTIGGSPISKSAAIFIPFCHDLNGGAPAILFTRRSFKLSNHKGEVCFPGGFEEQQDNSDMIAAAVREIIEEIGVQQQDLIVYGVMNPIPFRTFPLYPVVGYLKLNKERQLSLNKDEVESIHVIPLEMLAQKANWYKTKFTHGWTTPVFLDSERKYPRIWGMTASILYLTIANLIPDHFEFDFEYLFRGNPTIRQRRV